MQVVPHGESKAKRQRYFLTMSDVRESTSEKGGHQDAASGPAHRPPRVDDVAAYEVPQDGLHNLYPGPCDHGHLASVTTGPAPAHHGLSGDWQFQHTSEAAHKQGPPGARESHGSHHVGDAATQVVHRKPAPRSKASNELGNFDLNGAAFKTARANSYTANFEQHTGRHQEVFEESGRQRDVSEFQCPIDVMFPDGKSGCQAKFNSLVALHSHILRPFSAHRRKLYAVPEEHQSAVLVDVLISGLTLARGGHPQHIEDAIVKAVCGKH